MTGSGYFKADISRHVWDTKYRLREDDVGVDRDVTDTWRRVAGALAAVEGENAPVWAERFYGILEDFRFLPGGRILAGAGTERRVTLFNCFVMGAVADSIDGIFDGVKEGAITMQQGGGVGYDFSTLRPRGTPARSVGGIASGPVSFMGIWDAMCATLLSTGARRGAMMGTLRCDHPDIDEFIEAKGERGKLRHFNLSVLVTDAFMKAVENDQDWPLVFPLEAGGEGPGADEQIVERLWSGCMRPVPCRVHRRVRARELWGRLMRATYDYAEPGVLFIDRINALNNLYYREHISATNPCGEVPLPPYGACNLGSVNLTRFVRQPFTDRAELDMQGVCDTVELAVRMLDNVTDASRFPLPAQQEQARGSRRIGLGLTGLADVLIMLGLRYGEDASLTLAASVMRTICHAAYRASVALSSEKGPFPFFERDAYLAGGFVAGLPADIRDGIASFGIRNSHLTAIAPTGTVSLLANNISSGLEPVFDRSYSRRVLERDGSFAMYTLTDYAAAFWQELKGDAAALPDAYVDARRIAPKQHIAMQAALQPYVDSAISKTINVPEDYDFAEFQSLYSRAFAGGLKGCTTFRANPVTGEVLSSAAEPAAAPHCCAIEREAD